MIDFILCSPALGARYAKGSYHITAGTVETNGTDHNPVSAVFDLGSERSGAEPHAP
jgi:hypothetical protein